MGVFYAASTGGFYLDAMHKHIPDDAVEIDERDYEALLAGQAAGREIKPGPDGKPLLNH